MSLFKDTSKDCYRLCVGVTNLTLTRELGFEHMRGMTDEEKTVFMGVLIYSITGIKNASVARKVIKFYSDKFPVQDRGIVEYKIQDVYSKAREISENIMGKSFNALNDIIDAWIVMIISMLHWPSTSELKSTIKALFLNFYRSVYNL